MVCFSAVRKINELVKRVRTCKVHAYIIAHLKEQMPSFMGHAKKQKEVSLFAFLSGRTDSPSLTSMHCMYVL
jgi:hypothetical protein